MAEVLESADTVSGEAGRDIAGKIEEGVLRPWRRPEESFVIRVFGRERARSRDRALHVPESVAVGDRL